MPCVGVQLRWVDPERTESEPRELSSSLLRSIPLGTYIRRQRVSQAAYHAHRENVEAWIKAGQPRDPFPDLSATDEQVADARRRLEGRQGRPGRPAKRDVNFYIRLAAIYREALGRGDPPTLAITREHKQLGVKLSRSAAAKAVSKTRRLGLLGPAIKGRAGA